MANGRSRHYVSSRYVQAQYGRARSGRRLTVERLEDRRLLTSLQDDAFDFGDAPDALATGGRYPTLFANNGARHNIIEGGIRLGASVDSDTDGQPTLPADGDDWDHLLDFSRTSLVTSGLAPFSIQVPINGGAGIADGESFAILRRDIGVGLTFEFNSVDGLQDDRHIEIPFQPWDSVSAFADRIVTAVGSQPVLALQPANLGGGRVFVGGRPLHRVDTTQTSVTQRGSPAAVLQIPFAGGSAIRDGETITFDDGLHSITFEFDRDNPTGNDISYSESDAPITIAAAVVQAVADSDLNLTATNLGGGQIHLLGQSSHEIDLASSNLTTVFARAPVEVQAPGAGLSLHIDTVARIQVPAEGAAGIEDGQSFTLSDGLNPVIFEFDIGDGANAGSQKILFKPTDAQQLVAESIGGALRAALDAGLLVDLSPAVLPGGVVDLGAKPVHTLDTSASILEQVGSVADGSNFAIDSDGPGPGPSVIFEFDRDGEPSLPGSRRIGFTDTDSTNGIADRVVAAINNAVLAGFLQGITPVNLGGGSIDLIAGTGVEFVNTNAVHIRSFGVAGGVADAQTFTIGDGTRVVTFEFDRNGKVGAENRSVPFTATSVSDNIAAAVGLAINAAGFNLVTNSFSGGMLRFEGGDDDGVSFDSTLVPGQRDVPVTIMPSGPGVLNAWFDWNQDGDWDDLGEHVFRNTNLTKPTTLTLDVPQEGLRLSAGEAYARFRFSSQADLRPTGLARDGEVEDYKIRIVTNEAPTVVTTNDDPPIVGIPDMTVDESIDADRLILLDLSPEGTPALYFRDNDIINGNGDRLTYSVVHNDNQDLVRAVMAPNQTTLKLILKEDYNGTANIRIRATDHAGASVDDAFELIVRPRNGPPEVIVPGPQNVRQDTTLTITGIRVTDVDDEFISVSLTASHGTLTVSPTNATGNGTRAVTLQGSPATISTILAAGLDYRSLPDFNGPDTIEVRAVDGASATTSATIQLNVSPSNSAPFVANAIEDIVTAEDGPPIVINLFPQVFNDPDLVFGDKLTFSLVETYDTRLLDAAIPENTATLVLGLRPDASGNTQIALQARDSHGLMATDTFSITVSEVNDAPVAQDDQFVVLPKTTLPLDVLANDSDVDGVLDRRSLRITSPPDVDRATALANPDGTVSIRPMPGFHGTLQFLYTIADNLGAISQEAVVAVTVNLPPTAADDTDATQQDVPVNINVLTNDFDPEGLLADPPVIAITAAPGSGIATPNADGTVTYKPSAGFSGDDKFRYTVQDDKGAVSNEATVSVHITPRRSWKNAANPLDVDNNGVVSPLDALLIINRLNLIARTGGSFVLPEPPPGLEPPPFFDVNCNGTVDTNDALRVIDYLNSLVVGEGEAGPARAPRGAFSALVLPPNTVAPSGGSLLFAAAGVTTHESNWAPFSLWVGELGARTSDHPSSRLASRAQAFTASAPLAEQLDQSLAVVLDDLTMAALGNSLFDRAVDELFSDEL